MMHYDGEALVERIRRICKEKGISIAQMEKDLSWSQGLISRWTKNSPSVGKVMEVIKYLEVDYKAILGEIAFADEKPEEVELSEKLYRATEIGDLEWDICDKNFENIEIQDMLKQNRNCKIYRTLYDKGYFLLIINREETGTLEIGVVRGINRKIRYVEQKTEKWMEKLLELIDLNEYDIWDATKTECYIKEFMQDDFE